MEGFVQRRSKYVSLYAALIGMCVGSCVMRLCDGAAADSSTCPDALTKLFPCLPYSQGTAQVPTKDCCTNLLDVHLHKPQCLCALIAASVKGTQGVPKMNTTLSLTLGPACKVATNPSVCPDLLGLPPNDPLRKIFTAGASTPAPSNTTTSPAAQGPSTMTTAPPNAPPMSNKAYSLSLSASQPASFAFALVVLIFLF